MLVGLKMKKLNFGCGIDIKEEFDNVDFQNFDFNKFPYPLKDNIYDYILVRDVLEHLDYPNKVLDELHRICKKDAIIEIIVPYYNSAGAFGSMEHHHYFNRNCFLVCDMDTKNNKCLQTNYKVISVDLQATRLGKCIPSFIREKASFVIGEVYNSINCKLRVIK